MRKFIAALVDSRNRRVEAHLFLLCVGVATFIVLSIYHVVVLRNAFDANPYGQGLGTLLAGGGAAAWGQGQQRKAESNGKDNADESAQ